jgi:hypothetical protein
MWKPIGLFFQKFKNLSLTSVTLPESIITIGNYTFANNLINEIIIPNSVKSIGDYAFANNPPLNTIIFQGKYFNDGNKIFNNNYTILKKNTLFLDTFKIKENIKNKTKKKYKIKKSAIIDSNNIETLEKYLYIKTL